MTRKTVLSIFVFILILCVINLYNRTNSLLKVLVRMQELNDIKQEMDNSQNEALKTIFEELRKVEYK